MNSADSWGIRGEHIKPSARRSIHSHYRCPFSINQTAMDVLGKQDRGSPKNTFSTLESDNDVVDGNVVSKHINPSSCPMTITQKKILGRNSFSSDNQECSKDDDDDQSKMLSKSLPEILPSHLSYSDESHTEENDLQRNDDSHYRSFESLTNQSNQSFYQRLNNSSLYNRHNHQTELSEQFSTPEFNKESTPNRDNHTDKLKKKYWVGICIFIIVIAYIYNYSNITEDKNFISSADIYDKIKFYKDVSAIGKLYNLDQDSILQLQLGISSISEREDTNSFIFVYDSEKHNFNLTILDEFINEIASMSARYLRNESASVRHIVVHTSSIRAKNSEELIHRYYDDIVRGGVMVMTTLEMLPSSLAMALHYYCDEYNPLVKRSAMFFTMDIANCSDKQMSKHSNIEKCLKRKWNTVSSEFIDALLARVVSIVVDVTDLF